MALTPVRTVEVRGKCTPELFTVPEEWKLVKRLGSGAYGTVAAFKAKDGSMFAVKKVNRVFDHPVLALRTLREVRLLAHFRHSNILGLSKLFVQGATFEDVYMCMDLMDADLNHLIHASKDPLSDYQVQSILYQIMRGLLCFRNAKVIHRDLKPGNILVQAGGVVKIADLGLARTIDADEDDSGTAMDSKLTEYVVTRFYRPPEVVLTATQYTYAVDIWSSGCILGEMLTRQPLFEGKDSIDQIRKIVSVIGPPTTEDMNWIPRSSASWKFVERCSKQSTGEAFQKLMQWPGANPLATELLTQMLRFDPSRRISVKQALVHRYVACFNACEDPEVASALAVSPVDWSFDRDFRDTEGTPKPFDKDAFREAFLRTVGTVETGAEVAGDDSTKQLSAAPTSEEGGSPERRKSKSDRSKSGGYNTSDGSAPSRLSPEVR
eukprot:TRINITY_DN16312_c1_g1_i1.p1 TRINITY_DN16312_c1_g1~~TRINITY_DN16312_c1_g1_i1.p1  ORF type:complete len:458 (+),score=83.57 TRINITY_DN16312_c1_g1_i1:67-1374(+)